MSINADGTIVAIGAYRNDGNGSNSGHVRIYKYNGTAWNQLGSDIDGDAIDESSGWDVSLSSDGNTLAVGAPGNDRQGSFTGAVRAYEYNGTDWIQTGDTIYGESAGDRFGRSVSISSDGAILVVGAAGNDNNGVDSGHARVYQNVGGSWTQLCVDIEGESAGDNFGHVSLSSDGSTLAVGGFGNDDNGVDSGHVRVFDVPTADGFTDSAGNFNVAADQFSYTFDSTVPTISISSSTVSSGDISNDASIALTFTTSKATTNFAEPDVTVSGGSLSNFSATSSTVYTATFTPSGDGTTTVDVNQGVFTDNAGNNNTAASQFSWTYDGTSPTMAITSSTVSSGDISNDASIALTFTSSEATSNFAEADVTVSGGSLSNFSATSSTVYTATFTPSGDGTTTVDIGAGTFTDAYGNNNTAASQFSWTYDGTSPTMAITSSTVSSGDISNDASIALTFTSSEATSNFAEADVTVSGGSLSNFSATSSTVYTATFTPSGDGTTTVDIGAGTFTDAYGNNNTAASQFSWTYDITPPTMTISSSAVSNGGSSNSSSIALTFTSSEATSNFAEADVTVSGGSSSNFSATSSTVYTATFTPSGDGVKTLDVLSSCSGEFAQIGANIVGESSSDISGKDISLNSDGTILAIGARNNDGNGDDSGHVRVYQYSNGTWTQRGSDINGEALSDFSANDISLSDDGNILAIGAALNDGNGENSGHTRVYQYTDSDWVQMGADIDGESERTYSGYPSLSADGSTLAIGGFGRNSESGHVKVYQFDGTNWTQIGDIIGGENIGDRSGADLSINADGTIVAIGAYRNDGNGSNSGHVRIYKYNGTAWNQLGSDIDGDAIDESSGWDVSLSSDGNTLAVGAPGNDRQGSFTGAVRAYEYNGTDWIQTGDTIYGESAGDRFGRSVSISSDGAILVVGAAGNDNNGVDSGHARVYQNVGGSWTQLCVDIEGESAGDNFGHVSLSSDGSTLAVGGFGNDDNGVDSGHVRVFDVPTADGFTDSAGNFNVAADQFSYTLMEHFLRLMSPICILR